MRVSNRQRLLRRIQAAASVAAVTATAAIRAMNAFDICMIWNHASRLDTQSRLVARIANRARHSMQIA